MNQPIQNPVHIKIGNEPKVSPNPTTGSALYLLAAVAAGDDLWRETRGPGDDELIRNDATQVTLQPGDHLYTAQSSLNPG
jgi:hypothetical protein